MGKQETEKKARLFQDYKPKCWIVDVSKTMHKNYLVI